MGLNIITVGAGVQDVFLSGAALMPHVEDDGQMVESFNLGSKLDMDKIVFSTGGGATNAAVTFARLGVKTSFMGQIGHDPAGTAVLADLTHEGVKVDLVAYSQESTGYSVLLLSPTGERTILTYRGASAKFELQNFNFDQAQADWFYISSLDGNFTFLEAVLKQAEKQGAKVAFNPGQAELKNAARLKALLPKIEILALNADEAKLLFGGDGIQELAMAGAQAGHTCVVTDGPKGQAACDGQQVCWGGIYEDVPVLDRTGAGDAFVSGFVAMVALGQPLEAAVVYGSANSTSVVKQIGAKAGILRQGAQLHSMAIHSQVVK